MCLKKLSFNLTGVMDIIVFNVQNTPQLIFTHYEMFLKVNFIIVCEVGTL